MGAAAVCICNTALEVVGLVLAKCLRFFNGRTVDETASCPRLVWCVILTLILVRECSLPFAKSSNANKARRNAPENPLPPAGVLNVPGSPSVPVPSTRFSVF